MLMTKKLYFSRSDKFDDSFEGSKTQQVVQYTEELIRQFNRNIGVADENNDPDLQLRAMRIVSQLMRHYTYILCWHMSEFESIAMWKLYGRINESIAIQTTYQRLADCLPDCCKMGVVRYINYAEHKPEELANFSPYYYKRESFAYEQEVRAMIQNDPSENSADYLIRDLRQKGRDRDEQGRIIAAIEETLDKANDHAKLTDESVSIEVDLSTLIQGIYVSPTAPKWFLDVVKSVTSLYELDIPIFQSDINSEPLF